MIVEGAFVALTVLAWRKASSKGQYTLARQECYIQAMEHLHDPDKLRELADAFDKQGLPVQAYALRKRAELRGLDPGLKAAHKAAYEQGMKSSNIEGILTLAKAFDTITATATAKKLRAHALQVRLSAADKETAEWRKKEGEAKETPNSPAVEEKDVREVEEALMVPEVVSAPTKPGRAHGKRQTFREKGESPALKEEAGSTSEADTTDPQVAAVHGE